MKGLIGKAVAVLGCASALAGASGCYRYRDLVDPCYPERYRAVSRQNVNAAFTPQVRNGRVLDQTVWNYHFEPGTATLTPGAQVHLNYLARRRPEAEPVVFLQTAHDILYNAEKPADFVAKRRELDEKRMAAVKTYLGAQTAGGRTQDFQVVVHNPPPDTGIAGVQADVALRQLYATPQAVLPGTGLATSVGGQ